MVCGEIAHHRPRALHQPSRVWRFLHEDNMEKEVSPTTEYLRGVSVNDAQLRPDLILVAEGYQV